MCEDEYLPFVRQIAKVIARRTGRQGADYDDLVGAGTIGLVEALSRYDQTSAASFRTFAAYRVRGAMLDYLRSLDPLGRRWRDRVKQQGLDQPVTPVSEQAARDVPAPESDIERHVLAHQLLDRAPYRDQAVLIDTYWLGRSQQEIGHTLHITQGRVSQILLRALDRLQAVA